jgi:phosphatidylglycerophosphate synthase
MRAMRRAAIVGALATAAVLGVLSLTTGLGVAGWVVGLAAGWATTGLIVVGRHRAGQRILPPDRVTLARGSLIAGVAALVADTVGRPVPVVALVVLASVALALDAVDGPVARRTGTATPFGGRLDGEVDAFLILLLSVVVSREYGAWVLAIGLVRYALLVAGWAIPWLAAPLPFRYWRKVVTAVAGVALTAAASGVLPRLAGTLAVGAVLVLLAESFGRDVVWLYRTGAGPRTRRVLGLATALVAAAVLWAVLLAPDRARQLTPSAFARIPVELLVLVAIGLVLPARPRRVVALVAGVAIGLLTVIKIFDAGFYWNIGRPFDPLLDWGSLPPAIGVVQDSIGVAATDVLIGLLVVGLALLVVLVAASAVRVTTFAARYRRRSAGGVAVLGIAWGLSVALSLQLIPGTPLASSASVALAAAKVRNSQAALADRQRLAAQIDAADPYADIPASRLLSGLRGKDVIIAFVESYGQVAVQDTSFSAGVDAVLRSGTASLAKAGYSTRSAWLNSSTFGGISWLAHSTLQSGLWIDSQRRYDQLVASRRFTLSDAFGKAGWRTVSDIPSDDEAWVPGTTFYHYDQLYDRRNVGYRGPTFSYASMPDQYNLAAFQRLELTPGHRPVMAEIDLVSSHIPWTPLPRMVPWNELGNGSIFDPMPKQGLTPAVAWRNRSTVQQLYGQSIQYSLTALTSWVEQLHDENLVLVVLGDHQPWNEVSGSGANHQVPVSVVAHDPAVLARIASWDWQDGLLPGRTAPLWPMDAFRNRFLAAFSTPASSVVALPPSR